VANAAQALRSRSCGWVGCGDHAAALADLAGLPRIPDKCRWRVLLGDARTRPCTSTQRDERAVSGQVVLAAHRREKASGRRCVFDRRSAHREVMATDSGPRGWPATRTDRSGRLPLLLDIEGVAEVLGVSVRHVRRLVAERRIPYVKWGRFLRFESHRPCQRPSNCLRSGCAP